MGWLVLAATPLAPSGRKSGGSIWPQLKWLYVPANSHLGNLDKATPLHSKNCCVKDLPGVWIEVLRRLDKRADGTVNAVMDAEDPVHAHQFKQGQHRA
jgi:hypothetical protein